MTSGKSITAVFIRPLSITAQPQHVTVAPGDSANFTVSASGTEPLSYSWLFNGSPIEGASSTLTLNNVQLGSAGQYRAVVANPYGSVTSSIANLVVSCPGTNVMTTATDAALRSAIAIGGHVRLCFNGTVLLSNTIAVTHDVTLDASGCAVTLDGGGAIRLFTVATNVTFGLTNIMLANGRYVGTNGSNAGGFGQPRRARRRRRRCCNSKRWWQRSFGWRVLSNHTVLGGNGGMPNQFNAQMAVGGVGRGGALLTLGGSLLVRDAVFINNSASGGFALNAPESSGQNGFAQGGGVACLGGNFSGLDSTFVGNMASNYMYRTGVHWVLGGALYSAGCNVTVTNFTFSGNRAVSTGILFDGGTGNPASAASVAGGAVCIESGTAVFHSSRILTNAVVGGYSRLGQPGAAFGGAVFNGGTLTILQSALTGNLAAGGGGMYTAFASGGAIHSTGFLALVSTAINGSTAVGGNARSGGYKGGNALGGALTVSGTLVATNCTFTANAAIGGDAGWSSSSFGNAFGGALDCGGGSAILVNVTVATNKVNMPQPFGAASASCGANVAVSNSLLTVRNSLLVGVSNNVWGTIVDGGYNMSSDGSANFTSGTSFNFTDPRLLPLANNGGPTRTMALASDSPAIDWVPATNAPATDQRGVIRPFGAAADAGAFEVGAPAAWLSIRRIGGSVELSFPVWSGIPYRIEHSTALPSWQLQETLGVVPTNGTFTRLIPRTLSSESFRVVSY